MLHRFPQQVFVHRAKDFFGEVERADLFAIQIYNINVCHISSRYFFALPAAAFLAAFKGSSVVEPANPRRSCGGFFPSLVKTDPSLCPRTAPSTTNSVSFFSIQGLRRLRMGFCLTPVGSDVGIAL